MNVLVSVAGGAILHLVVVRIINQKSMDTTVLIPFVKSRILCRKELFCSVVADFLILDSLEVFELDVTILSIVLGYVSSTYGPC